MNRPQTDKMKKTAIFLNILSVIALILFPACNDGANGIGTSLVKDQTEIIMDSVFILTGESVENNRIQSRTITQVLGNITAEGYGEFTSDFVTQFMAATKLDTDNVKVEDIDSLKLIMRIPKTAVIGDSLAPMGLQIYTLTKPLPSPIYSDFNPDEYYDSSKPVISQVYKSNVLEEGDTAQMRTSTYIFVNLPKKMGQDLYKMYLDNPATYATPSSFTKAFPGFYVKHNYGSGNVVKIEQTVMRMYYHKNSVNSAGRDTTIRYTGYYYGVQPEVVTNNIIRYRMADNLRQRLDKGENLLVAPAGRDVEMTFPALDVIKSYRDKAGKLSVINTLTMKIPVESIENNYGITPPSSILMILSKDKDKFFVDNDVNNDVTSFIGTYDATNRCYSFTGLRGYLVGLLAKEEIKPEDYTFTITPVSLVTTTEASTYYYYYGTTETVNAIVPYVGVPVMATLNLKEAKIILTFSKQNGNLQ